jgi:hypothetical protein
MREDIDGGGLEAVLVVLLILYQLQSLKQDPLRAPKRI